MSRVEKLLGNRLTDRISRLRGSRTGCGTCLTTEELIREADRRKFSLRNYDPHIVEPPKLPDLDICDTTTPGSCT